MFKTEKHYYKPCIKHKLAFKVWKDKTRQGMAKHGIKFKYCPTCDWVVQKDEHANISTKSKKN